MNQGITKRNHPPQIRVSSVVLAVLAIFIAALERAKSLHTEKEAKETLATPSRSRQEHRIRSKNLAFLPFEKIPPCVLIYSRWTLAGDPQANYCYYLRTCRILGSSQFPYRAEVDYHGLKKHLINSLVSTKEKGPNSDLETLKHLFGYGDSLLELSKAVWRRICDRGDTFILRRVFEGILNTKKEAPRLLRFFVSRWPLEEPFPENILEMTFLKAFDYQSPLLLEALFQGRSFEREEILRILRKHSKYYMVIKTLHDQGYKDYVGYPMVLKTLLTTFNGSEDCVQVLQFLLENYTYSPRIVEEAFLGSLFWVPSFSLGEVAPHEKLIKILQGRQEGFKLTDPLGTLLGILGKSGSPYFLEILLSTGLVDARAEGDLPLLYVVSEESRGNKLYAQEEIRLLRAFGAQATTNPQILKIASPGLRSVLVD